MPNCNTEWLFSKIPRSSAAHLRISRDTPVCHGAQFEKYCFTLLAVGKFLTQVRS